MKDGINQLGLILSESSTQPEVKVEVVKEEPKPEVKPVKKSFMSKFGSVKEVASAID
jgi:hypothetical protein